MEFWPINIILDGFPITEIFWRTSTIVLEAQIYVFFYSFIYYKLNRLLKMMEGGCRNYFAMLPSKGVGLAKIKMFIFLKLDLLAFYGIL